MARLATLYLEGVELGPGNDVEDLPHLTVILGGELVFHQRARYRSTGFLRAVRERDGLDCNGSKSLRVGFYWV